VSANVTVSAEAFETILAILVRATQGVDEDALASVRLVAPMVYEVTVLDGSAHRTVRVRITADGFVMGRADAQRCAECGDELGHGARVEDDRTATFRGTMGRVFLSGCDLCCAHVERERAA
jgi:hypothetical protein